MAEQYTAERLLELLNNDFDVSEDKGSEFEEYGIYSYLPGTSTGDINLTEEPEACPDEVANQSGSEAEVISRKYIPELNV